MTSVLKTAVKLNKYVVYAPDYADALPRRLAVREKHLQDTHESWKKGEMGELYFHHLESSFLSPHVLLSLLSRGSFGRASRRMQS